MTKKTLAIFSLTSCEGCQFEMLNFYADFAPLLNFYDINNFRLGQEDNFDGPFDVTIIEGSPDGERQKKLLRHIREQTGILIALGACAALGGIQSERNQLPRKIINKDRVVTVSDVVKVDFTIPGCPINHKELYKCLLDVYWGKIFSLPDLSVCFECRQNSNECLLKNQKPCLGPITRMGCNSICVNKGEACLGCRGTIPEPNMEKMKDTLAKFTDSSTIHDIMTMYGNLDK